MNSQAEVTRALQDKFGPYPLLWKEVLNWPGWKETRKEYLKAMQLQDNQVKIEDDGGDGSMPRKRKSRWGKAASNEDGQGTNSMSKRFAPFPTIQQQLHQPRVVLPSISSVGTNLTQQQQEDLRIMQTKLRAVNDRLQNLEQEAARVDSLPRGHRDRSPSPPPIYGADGKRKNTRAVRWRERYTAERQDLLEGIMRLSNKGAGGIGVGLPAGAASLLVRRRVKKIRIPVEEHPNYNFIGLIIGPRGKTQKELESKTGCKIAIRGRGSVKEGARGRRDGKVMEGDNEPLHVVISGDDQRAVDAASDMVEQMLVVIDDEKNVHKQQQLRELALLNGTLKEEDVFCQICAEKGHRSFECPKRFAIKGGAVEVAVKCAICGDTSHPTRDCTQRKICTPAGPATGDAGSSQQQMDSEYLSFMAELEGKKAEASQPTSDLITSKNGNDKLPPPPPTTATVLPPPLQLGVLPPIPTDVPPKPPTVAPPSNVDLASTQYQYRPPQQNSLYGQFHQGQQHDGSMSHQQYQQEHGGMGAGHYNNRYSHGNSGYQQPQQQHTLSQQQPQQRTVAQVNPGEETAGWDPSSYYGNYDSSAGGFNWWEQ